MPDTREKATCTSEDADQLRVEHALLRFAFASSCPRLKIGQVATVVHLQTGGLMLYMIIEHFREGDPRPVYRRFREQGRLAPGGLRYVSSWVTTDLRHCYQVMECDDRRLLDEWIDQWRDLVEFECIPVITSPEASAAVTALETTP